MEKIVLTLKKLFVGTLFAVMVLMPVVSFAETTIPSGYLKVDDIAFEMVTKGRDRGFVKNVMSKYILRKNHIAGKVTEIVYDKKNKNELEAIVLAPIDGALNVKFHVLTADKSFNGKVGDIAAFNGIAHMDQGGALQLLSALQFGGQEVNVIFITDEPIENLSASGFGGMTMMVVLVAGIAILGGGFYFYKKKNGNINIDDIKEKASEAAKKAKDGINVDDIKQKAEQAKKKATDKFDDIKKKVEKDK